MVKIKFFDLLSIYSVKYDPPGLFFSKMLWSPFLIFEMAAFSPKAEQRRCKCAGVSHKYINANKTVLISACRSQALAVAWGRVTGASEPEASG